MTRPRRRRGSAVNILLLLLVIGALQVLSGTERGAEVGWGLIVAVTVITAGAAVVAWVAWRLGWRPWGRDR